LKVNETTKLFYDRYVYRATIYVPLLASIFREKKFNITRNVLDNLNQQLEEGNEQLIWNRGPRYSRAIAFDTFSDAQNLYKMLSSQPFESYKLRVEGFFINYYTNEEHQFDKLVEKFKHTITEISKPEPNIKNHLRPNVIVKDSDYEYKVTVGPSVDPSVATWFESNPDKIKIGKTFLNCIKEETYVKGFYFYVKNEKILSIVKIILGGRIHRIDKFVSKLEL